MKMARGLILFGLAALLTALAAGCAGVERKGEETFQGGGQVTLYLNGPERTSQDITFEVSAIEMVSEDGAVRQVTSAPLEMNSRSVTGKQLFLGEANVPEGKYKKLVLVVKEASLRREGRKADLALASEKVEIPVSVTVENNQNTTLFVLWNPDASISDTYLFSPSLSVRGEEADIISLLVFVTNENSDNVTVINRQEGKVVATVKTGRKPRGVATSLLKDHIRVFVANSGSGSVSVIDPTTNKVEADIPVRFGTRPEGIAVAKVSDTRQLLVVANYGSNNISLIDAVTLAEIDKVPVGMGPIAVAADPPLEDFLQSRFLSFRDLDDLRSYREQFLNLYVVNQNSRDVTVVRLDIASGRFARETFTIPVEWSPIGATVDPQRAKVYVANYDSDRISVIDILRIVRGDVSSAVSTITNVGTTGVGIIPDPSLDRLYFLREVPGEIVFIRPTLQVSGTGFAELPPILGSIDVGRSPRSFILDTEGRKLYVVDRGANDVAVVDKMTRKIERVIPVGRKPYGVAMFPEL